MLISKVYDYILEKSYEDLLTDHLGDKISYLYR